MVGGLRTRAAPAAALVWDNHGCPPLKTDVGLMPQLERYWAAGVHVVSLNVGFADMPWMEHQRALALMRRMGMVLCLSHASAPTAAEALEYARNPVIFSHSNPHGDTAHPRNVSDALMRACAAKGGVIGLSGVGPFLGGDENLVEHLLRQLRYAVDLVGADHVGLGLDFDFAPQETSAYMRLNPGLFPPGMGSTGELAMLGPESFRDITDRLAGAGLSDDQIHGILGGNWRRIAALVWR